MQGHDTTHSTTQSATQGIREGIRQGTTESATDGGQAFYEGLRDLIAQPNPMCLCIVRAYPGIATFSEEVSGARDADSRIVELMELLEVRLAKNLRKYDVSARIEASGFVVILRTLADVRTLDNRIFGLHSEFIKPFKLHRGTANLPVVVGGAVRVPAEKPSALMARAEEAQRLAASAGGKAPILL